MTASEALEAWNRGDLCRAEIISILALSPDEPGTPEDLKAEIADLRKNIAEGQGILPHQMTDAVLVECGLNWAELLQKLQLAERLPRRAEIMKEKTNALRARLGESFEFEALDAIGAWTVRGPVDRLPSLLAGSEFRVVPSMSFETK